MFNLDNAKLVLDLVKENYKEISDLNKRAGDRTTFVLVATLTSFGLIAKIDDHSLQGWSLTFLLLSIASLISNFACTAFGLFPRTEPIPGVDDVDVLWKDVRKESDVAFANVMNDWCQGVKRKKAANTEVAKWLRLNLVFSAISIISIAISETLSAL